MFELLENKGFQTVVLSIRKTIFTDIWAEHRKLIIILSEL